MRNPGLIKDIGNYTIYSNGTVFNNKLNIWMKPQSVGKNRFGNSRLMVGLRVNGKRTLYYIHRLIAESFIPNPENKRTVNHIDGNTENNDITNLEWATDSENQIHSYRVLGRKPSGAWAMNKNGVNNGMYGRTGQSNPNWKHGNYCK
jgi:hypothetical protein